MKVIHSLSLTEKVAFVFFIILFLGSAISLLWQVNQYFMVEVPSYGGELVEGVIGSPRFVNPILAISDTDRDLSTLIYSGLMKTDSSGNLIPDLAQSYYISDDGLQYVFKLKDKIYFHDGTKITADDIVFTVEKAQDINIKSPRKTNWDGVQVEKIDDKTIRFTLKQAYSPFIQNTTLGILPKHIWKNASSEEFPWSEYNTKAVGSGPYKVESISYTGSGLPSEYHLVAFDKYALSKPYITKMVIKTFQNEKDLISAYKNGDIESMHSISASKIKDLKITEDKIKRDPLPRIFGVFFNQNVATVLVHKEVRQALDMATNRKEIVNNVLNGYGQSISGPIPQLDNYSDDWTEDNIQKAQDLLIKNGWKKNSEGIFEKKDKKQSEILSLSISTSDAPELKNTAEIIQRQWQKIGARVDIKIFEVGDLNQNIIRPRKYDALLFGEIIGKDMDLYPFWHSSQRTDPGLNIAMYANVKTDKILENIRKTTNIDSQKNLYKDFDREIFSDIPAIFLYSPDFIYIISPQVKNIKLGQLTVPAERWDDINKWYIETDKVWSIFAR